MSAPEREAPEPVEDRGRNFSRRCFSRQNSRNDVSQPPVPSRRGVTTSDPVRW